MGRVGGEGLKGRGAGATALRIVNPGNVADLIADSTTGRAAADVPSPEGEFAFPEMPAEVRATPALAKAWAELVPIFMRNGVLHQPDVVIVEMMLRHFVAFRDASDELMFGGPVVSGVLGGEIRNPADAVMRSQSQLLMMCLKEMGLTLVARARQPGKGSDEKPTEDNPYAQTGS